MTTYYHKKGVGIGSQCDANSRITYYEYDGLGRLSFVRDENKNILKKLCYSYTGQPVNCGYGTGPAWQSISSTCQNTDGVNTGLYDSNGERHEPFQQYL
ncbi:MAG: hypothetical protein WDO16_02205 [Bacteroidota bacterium]